MESTNHAVRKEEPIVARLRFVFKFSCWAYRRRHSLETLPTRSGCESTNSLDLSYTFRALGWHRENIGKPLETNTLVVNADLVNRSPKNMSLEFTLLIRLPNINGEIAATGAKAEWKERLTAPEFAEVANIPRETSVSGILVFRVPTFDLVKSPVKDVSKIPYSKMALKITDRVSGGTVLSSVYRYPPELEGGFKAILCDETEADSGKNATEQANDKK